MKNNGLLRNKKIYEVVSNLSLTIVANFISMIGSIVITFLLPKFIGITQYGYYQLYVFYASYIGFLGFGWHEGVYLRFGGAYYNELDKSLFKTQWKYYSYLELVIGFLICLFGILCNGELEKKIVFSLVALCVIVYLSRAFLHNILQATNRIKEHAIGLSIEKVVHVLLTCIFLLLRLDSFVVFILADLTGRLCAACYIAFVCRDLISARAMKLRDIISEIRLNMKAGINLMLANIASLLVIGIVRQAIEVQWDVRTFGKVSLTLSISNLLMIFVRAVSTTVFPMLRRTNFEHLNDIYSLMRTCLMIPLLGILIFCYPIQLVASSWLPQYADTLRYMAILFPLCVFESKSSMLIETFMKTVRKERLMLYMNGLTVCISVVSTIVLAIMLHNLDAIVFSIVFLVTFRSVFGEILLSRSSGIRVMPDIVRELFMAGFFIVFNWFVGGWLGFVLYLIMYICYIISLLPNINKTVFALRKLTTRRGEM